jgi:hypothetical protein
MRVKAFFLRDKETRLMSDEFNGSSRLSLANPYLLRKLKLLRTFVKHGFLARPEKFAGDSRW